MKGGKKWKSENKKQRLGEQEHWRDGWLSLLLRLVSCFLQNNCITAPPRLSEQPPEIWQKSALRKNTFCLIAERCNKKENVLFVFLCVWWCLFVCLQPLLHFCFRVKVEPRLSVGRSPRGKGWMDGWMDAAYTPYKDTHSLSASNKIHIGTRKLRKNRDACLFIDVMFK